MITKEITLCGKQVTLAYCFGTEIGFKLLTEQECSDFMKEVIIGLNAKKDPDRSKSMSLIVSAMTAYYESLPAGPDGKKQESPVTDEDIIYRATIDDLGLAVGTIVGLYLEFYKIPVGEPEDKEPKDKRVSRKKKNA